MPATATTEPTTNRPSGRCPSMAQPSRLLGMSSSANIVATTPEVMYNSAT